jgi:hypothetical protein
VAKFPMLNVGLWVADRDVLCDVNQCNLTVTAAEIPTTVFGCADSTDRGWETSIAGKRSAKLTYAGFSDFSAADLSGQTFADLGGLQPITVLPDMTATPALGDLAYFFRARRYEVSMDDTHGDVAKVAVTATGSSATIRGRLMVPKAAVAATGASASSQVGAVSATQSVYASLHVFAVSGTSPTLDVTVGSDDNSDLTSETSRLTFPQATAVGSGWQSLAGAITDDYWVVNYIIGGTTPSFTFAVALGIA